MLGILGWLMFGSASLHQKAIDDISTKKSCDNAKKNNSPYYYDSKGHKFMTDSDIQVYRAIEYVGNRKHSVLKSVEYGCTVKDLTQENICNANKNSKKKAIEKGRPVYYDFNGNNKYYTCHVYRNVNNDNEMFCEYKIRDQIFYYPLEFDKVENGVNYYKKKLDGMYWICTIDPDDKTEEWIKVDWRGYSKVICNSNYSGFYTDIFDRKIKEDGKKYDVVWCCDDDLPWAVEYISERYHNCGIKRLWRLYENEDGTFTRETRWYHVGDSLKFGDSVKVEE